MRKDSLDASDLTVDAHHVTLANLGTMAIQAVNNPALISSPPPHGGNSDEQQIVGAGRTNIEALYINGGGGSAGSPQFQLNRQTQETLVRHVNEQLLREHLAREQNLNNQQQQQQRESGVRVLDNSVQETTQAIINRHLAAAAAAATGENDDNASETLRQQISESTQTQELEDQQSGNTITHTMTVDADGNLTSSGRGLHLLSQSLLPGHLQFTTLLNSELVTIGEAVIRNPNANGVPSMFQHKFAPTQ